MPSCRSSLRRRARGRAEYRLFERFAELTEGSTALFVAHGLGSVRMADGIVVLLDGRIAEEGNHVDLLAARGEYAEMSRMQAGRYGSYGD